MPANPKPVITRRAVLTGFGAVGAAAFAARARSATAAESGGKTPARSADSRKTIREAVFNAALIDTHEHLIEEKERLLGAPRPRVPCDDWALLCSHYLDSDLQVAGMPKAELDRFLSPNVAPADKWPLLAPYWPAVKNTGYAQAVRLAIRELYGVEELSAATVPQVQAGYERTRRPGFYRHILQEVARIESCQVNALGEPFRQSAQPTLLMQDISIVGMFAGPNLGVYGKTTGLEVKGLEDWHRVIAWWFERYARYAVAVKSQNAYSRDIDYERVPAEQAEPVFTKVLRKEPVSAAERKRLEDHLFWQAVDQATAHALPVKLHTGYYAGLNRMPLARVRANLGSASDLCRLSPNTQFVFMHLGYPHYEETLALAKQYANAHVDMCWSWIINPVAAKDYFKKHVVTAPANKLLPFGGDYSPVEPVLGHAIIARRGIAQALAELVDEGWLTLGDALELVDPVLHGNARRLFRLAEKTAVLQQVEWNKA
jgi:predicted TIM-barrel fold metal-dependent hydrolase